MQANASASFFDGVDGDPERPARPPWTDVAVAVAFASLGVIECALREGIRSRGATYALSVPFFVAVALRRSHPGRATIAIFAYATLLTIVERVGRYPALALHASAAVLLMPYTLLRWGSRREIALGVAMVTVAFLSSTLSGGTAAITDTIAAAVALALPATIGASARYRAIAQQSKIDLARSRERESLARELHDTVAHHMTAIVVQAQAARVVAAKKPAAALEALSVIEQEASRAMLELRAVVASLRDRGPAALAPRARIEDISALARVAQDGAPAVEVSLEGALDALDPALQATLFRLAQESVTNALRHARRATVIHVRIIKKDRDVTITVRDDGAPGAGRRPGFGLAGMAERAALFGATFDAGPDPEGGWRVEAVFRATEGLSR